MNRTFLIARRELMAYVRTVGFWLSLLSLPLFASLGGVIPMLAMNSEPTRSVAVVEVASGAPLKAGVEARLTARDRERQVDVISALVIPEAGIEASRQ
ncbi:MAG: ABC transporter permease, partial [Brevundimonas sp.]